MLWRQFILFKPLEILKSVNAPYITIISMKDELQALRILNLCAASSYMSVALLLRKTLDVMAQPPKTHSLKKDKL